MIPIFDEVYSLDKICYEKGLSEDILMENASQSIYKEIKKRGFKSVCIIAGNGNNGADGITLARILLNEIEVSLFLPLGIKSEMGKIQLERYKKFGGKFSEITPNKTQLKNYDCYVDSIFGSGLKRDLSPKLNKIIKELNKKDGFKIACDIPTGIDENGNLRGEVFKADLTVTMGALKLSLYSDFAKDYVGKIKIANLGVSFKNYIKKSNYFLLQKKDMQLPFRNKKNAHKGSFGHLGVLVGEKEGAGVISSLSALNFGVGLVTAVTKEKIQIPYEIMHSYSIGNYSAIVFGMGMGNFYDDELNKICNLKIPKVIDADMFYKIDILNCLTKNVVLTPHPKEFSSLLKICKIGDYSVEEIQKDRFKLALKFSEKYPDVVLLLKGANSIIAYKKQLYINRFGTQALSKGGSGDVLAGMIGALLAQKQHPLKATITATIAHSLAGDIKPNYSLTPLKLIKNIGRLYS
jgi:hydroxyethylthiazole kinase-like uncharacterized protein yjeF